jgi:hypothetical protein
LGREEGIDPIWFGSPLVFDASTWGRRRSLSAGLLNVDFIPSKYTYGLESGKSIQISSSIDLDKGRGLSKH